MKGQGSYVPPQYIPLSHSDPEAAIVAQKDDLVPAPGPAQWTSGICACCDDMQSCCIGLLCPCYLFGRNAEFLGSGTLAGSCMTHFILCGIANTLCCVLSEGLLLGFPGCTVACYACGYRKALRSKYNLPEAPCGDFVTHLCCHLCALCQEYREIRERSGNSTQSDLTLAEITAPAVQKMESAPTQERK